MLTKDFSRTRYVTKDLKNIFSLGLTSERDYYLVQANKNKNIQDKLQFNPSKFHGRFIGARANIILASWDQTDMTGNAGSPVSC